MREIQNIQTKDYIANAIRNEILSGGMKPGEELAQEALANQLGVSRMPVREALQALEQEGFLERLPNRHMRVVGIEQEKTISTFRIIAAMEAEMAALLCEEKKEISSLEAVLKEIEKAMAQGNNKQAALMELDFHRQLSNSLDNKYLEQLHAKLLDGYVAYTITEAKYNSEPAFQSLKMILENMIGSRTETFGNLFKQYYRNMANILLARQEEIENE